MKKRRNILVGFVAVVVMVAGIILLPKTASAETVNGTNGIIYVKDSTNYNFKTYWSEKKAPVKEGYIFAGWYSEASEGKYLTETDAASATEAWAKFVPDYVLSVRAQNEAGTSATDNKASSTRVLSSVDSADYQNVGFDIWLANKTQLTMKNEENETVAPLITTKAFKNILVNEEPVSATDTFGAAAKYFVVWRLDNIANENDSKIIYVRPYWITMDGTTVYGLAKYVHVEDEYKGYISVPINLMTGEAIAAGVIKMTYTDLEVVGVEKGRLLKEMNEKHDTAGLIKMAGNAEQLNEIISADGIYANIRFKKPTTEGFDPNKLTFGLSEEADFSDWDEEEVTITPIIQY